MLLFGNILYILYIFHLGQYHWPEWTITPVKPILCNDRQIFLVVNDVEIAFQTSTGSFAIVSRHSLCTYLYCALWYRVLIKYCVFSLKCLNFLKSASTAAEPVFYLSKHDVREKTERGQSSEYVIEFSNKHNIKWTPCIS